MAFGASWSVHSANLAHSSRPYALHRNGSALIPDTRFGRARKRRHEDSKPRHAWQDNSSHPIPANHPTTQTRYTNDRPSVTSLGKGLQQAHAPPGHRTTERTLAYCLGIQSNKASDKREGPPKRAFRTRLNEQNLFTTPSL